MIFCQRAAGLPDCLKIMRKGEIVMKKWVYLFTEGNADMRELLGGKGANLAEMTGLGLPVPQGFTITTEDRKSVV